VKLRDETDEPPPQVTAGGRPKRGRPALHQLVPWFIIGFLLMVALRSASFLPAPVLLPIATASTAFMIISMAALGLGVDVRTVSKAGGRVTVTVILSLMALGTVSFLLVKLLGL
jgi:uncharacterized membrane protein YadS